MKKYSRHWRPRLLRTLACSTMTTAVDYDHTVNWSQFHTFQLAEGTKDPDDVHAEAHRGRHHERADQSKGWTVATSRTPTSSSTRTSSSASEKQWNATSMGGFGYRGWGGMGGGMATATQTNIPIGTIIVDIVNPKTHEMIWRGTAQDQVSGTGADKGQVQDAMTAIFKNFPPAPGK